MDFRFVSLLLFMLLLISSSRSTNNSSKFRPFMLKRFVLSAFSFVLFWGMALETPYSFSNVDCAQFGNQVWMSKSLAVTAFRNGDKLVHAKSAREWKKALKDKTPAYCVLWDGTEFEAVDYAEEYGLIYNVYAVTDPRQLAPEGFRIPDVEDWTELVDFFGGPDLAGEMMKSDQGWYNNGNGRGLFDFNALPGGGRYGSGKYLTETTHADYWIADPISNGAGPNDYIHLYFGDRYAAFCPVSDFGSGLYVRCVKD